MGELQQVGALDPVAQDKLMADLKQVDPSLWPMVLQTFRAEAAYKRREEQREAAEQKPKTADADPRRDYPPAKSAGTGEQETRFELKPAVGQPPLAASPKASNKEEPLDALAPLPTPLATANTANRPALSPEPPVTGGIDSHPATPATAVEKPSPIQRAARGARVGRSPIGGNPIGGNPIGGNPP